MAEFLPVGGLVGGYRITGVLGQGGMGVVYSAEHEVLRRAAAVKVLSRDLAVEEAFRDRFIAESQMLAALEHPNIVPIYDAGRLDGVVYLAMKHVAGGDLAARLGGGPLAPAEALELGQQVAGALDAAHAQGLVHRDVKPANVLLDGRDGRVFLTDFGIAKLARSGSATPRGLFVGTLDYAAPEQIRGDDVGLSADVYAFGCLLFECLSGRKPFDRETDVAVMHAHLAAERPLISSFCPALPRQLDAVLAAALAVDPSERFNSCQAVVDAMRAVLGVGYRAAAAVASSAPVSSGRLRGFPSEPTPLIGRDTDLRAVAALLVDPDVRLLTLTGLGGSGKTRLAVAAARSSESSFAGMYFVDLSGVDEAGLVGPAIAAAIGAEEERGDRLVETLGRRFGGDPACLVLDNFEQVVAAAPFVHDLLGAAETLTVLVTSRTPLRLREEREFPVAPLSLTVDTGGDSAAVDLFVERARAARPDFTVTDSTRGEVEQICALLDGLPLAIELAAARVKLLPPAAIRERLAHQRLELLSGGASDLPERQRTMRGTIAWSYGLLSADEQRLLNRLSVFAGGCTLEAADAVCLHGAETASALDLLASLVEKGLLRQREGADGEARFSLYETIRAYAGERLKGDEERAEVERRHAVRYLELAEAAAPELTRPNQAIWLLKLDEENDNVRAALAWSTRAAEHTLALRFIAALARFWSTRGQLTEAARWVTAALPHVGVVDPALGAEATFAAGYTALGEGDFGAARMYFEQSLSLSEEAGSERARAAALAQLAWLALAGGDLAVATDLAGKSVELALAVDDKLSASGATTTLAEAALAGGDFITAASLFDRGLELRRVHGDRRLVANSLLGLGRVNLLQGRLEAAEQELSAAHGLGEQLSDTWTLSLALLNLGRLQLLRDQPSRARQFLDDALRLGRERNDQRLIGECIQAFGAACALERRTDDAVRLFAAADRMLELTGAAPSPLEQDLRRRFLDPLADDSPEFAAAWENGRLLGANELDATAVATPRSSAATVVAADVVGDPLS